VWGIAGATENNSTWELAPYSGRGDWIGAAGPTDNLLGARPSLTTGLADWNAYAYWSGTSFSAAVITGLIAAQLPVVGRTRLRPPSPGHTLDLPDDLLIQGSPGRTIPLYGSKDVILQP
jgi:subtilisin family serine protease